MTKKTVSILIILLIVFSFIFTGAINALAEAHSSTVSDNIITGNMDGYSRDFIIVDNVRYGFCSGIEFFTKSGIELPLRDIDAALEVQLYESTGCITKIIVLSFAH